MSSDDLWNALCRVTRLEIEARTGRGDGWNGTGQGKVRVERPDYDTIVFAEAGNWDGAGPRFLNRLRWKRPEPERIGLEHLRQGLGRPVFLVELVEGVDGIWRSAEPHRCGSDRYSATVRMVGDSIELRWTVTGPDKDQVVRVAYRAEASPAAYAGGDGTASASNTAPAH